MNDVTRRRALALFGTGTAATVTTVGASSASAAVKRVPPVPVPSAPNVPPTTSVAPAGTTVTRTTASLLYRVNVRETASLDAPVVTTLANGSRLTGSYDASGLWFQITDGVLAGRWTSASVLLPAPAKDVNGRLAAADVTLLPAWATNLGEQPTAPRYLSCAAAVAYLALADAFRAQFGTDLTITEAYRTLSRQQVLYRSLGYPRAAVPGTSNHGLGNAIDFGIARTNAVTSKLYFGRAYDVWLTNNALRWGFDRPSYMDRRGSNPEWWHYNFVG